MGLFVALIYQITVAITLLFAEAHLFGVPFSILGVAPAVHADDAEALAKFFLANLSARPEGYFYKDFIHYDPFCCRYQSSRGETRIEPFIYYIFNLSVWRLVV